MSRTSSFLLLWRQLFGVLNILHVTLDLSSEIFEFFMSDTRMVNYLVNTRVEEEGNKTETADNINSQCG